MKNFSEARGNRGAIVSRSVLFTARAKLFKVHINLAGRWCLNFRAREFQTNLKYRYGCQLVWSTLNYDTQRETDPVLYSSKNILPISSDDHTRTSDTTDSRCRR